MHYPSAPASASDEGLGLVEIVVAMFVLAVLSLALLPLLIFGMQASARNTTLAAASQLANDRINIAQSRGPICADVLVVAGDVTLVDPRGVELIATTTVGACPGGVGTVAVSTDVVRTDTGDTVASADTLVFVSA
jgi:type II secretory pathway pseudopilin PulG